MKRRLVYKEEGEVIVVPDFTLLFPRYGLTFFIIIDMGLYIYSIKTAV